MLDLSFVRDLVRECYASSGRPSVDPVVFFRLQLVMFFENIRSERQLSGGRGGPEGLLRGLSSGQSSPEARPDRGTQGYADIKPNPGPEGCGAHDPAEHGPHKSAYPDAPGLSGLHAPTFPLPIHGAIVVQQRGPEWEGGLHTALA